MDNYQRRETDPKLVKGNGRRFSEATKLALVRDVVSGRLTVLEACYKYDVSRGSAHLWINQFNERVEQELHPKPLSEAEQREIEALARRNQELEAALEAAQLRAQSMETMIELAEQTYRLDIRKKFGTKQPK